MNAPRPPCCDPVLLAPRRRRVRSRVPHLLALLPAAVGLASSPARATEWSPPPPGACATPREAADVALPPDLALAPARLRFQPTPVAAAPAGMAVLPLPAVGTTLTRTPCDHGCVGELEAAPAAAPPAPAPSVGFPEPIPGRPPSGQQDGRPSSGR